MKVKNLNNSSVKTKNEIRRVFAEIMAEKRDIDKVSVTELAKRANISRATFYAHYDDVYAVAEDYESDLLELSFTNGKLLEIHSFKKFIESFFDYIIANQETYKMLCQAGSIMNSATRISTLAKNKFYELCLRDPKIVNRDYLEVEIAILFDGILNQYIRFCRNTGGITLEQLRSFTLAWADDFWQRRISAPEARKPALN